MAATVALPPRVAAPSAAHTLRPLPKLLIVAMIAVQAVFCWMARDRSLRGEVDLRTFYTAGLTVRQGEARLLYTPEAEARRQQQLFAGRGRTLPFLYPAFAALFFVPLSLLPYPAAFGVLLAVNLVALLAAARLLAPVVPGISTGWLFALFVSFFPVAIALMQGQISFLLLLIFVGAYRLAGQGSHALAGLCLSLALVKFQLALPLMLIFLLRRNGRIFAGFAGGALVLAFTSVLLAGEAGTRAYLQRLEGVSTTMLLDHAAAEARFAMQTSAEPTLHGLMARLAGPGVLGILLWVGCSLVALAAAVRASSPAAALPAAMLVSYHLQPYDLTLLLLPATLLLLSGARTGLFRRPFAGCLALAAVGTLSIPIGPVLLATQHVVWFALPVATLVAACVMAGSPAQPSCPVLLRPWPAAQPAC